MNEKQKITVFTIGFCRAETWRQCLENLYKTKSDLTEWDYYFMNHFYPEDMANNREKLFNLCEQYKIKWFEHPGGKNLGAPRGTEWAMRGELNFADTLLGIDPDSEMLTPGWDLALFKVMQDPTVGWAGIKQGGRIGITENELKERPHYDTVINGIDVHVCDVPMMMGVSMFKTNWILNAGGIENLDGYYGGNESVLFPSLKRHGLKLVMLKNYYEAGDIKASTQSPLYEEWKRVHAAREYPGNFDEFLKTKGEN